MSTMNQTEYWARIGAGITLALVSTAALVLALAGIVTTVTEMALAIAAGIALQTCLYLFARNGERVVSGLLLAVSVSATTAFCEYAWQQRQSSKSEQQQRATAGSYVSQQLKQQIGDLNNQISMRLQNSARDIAANYRSRGINSLSDVDALTQQRDRLLEKLQALKTAVSVKASGSIDAVVSNAHWMFRMGVFIVLAWLIDFCAIRCLSTVRPGVATLRNAAAEQSTSDETETEESQQQPVLHEDATVQRIMKQLLSGAYGKKPVVRKIIEKEKVRHPIVKQAFATLEQEGLLVKNGQRFELTVSVSC